MKTDTSWREAMTRAYAAGVEDGKRGWQQADRAQGFAACYWQGWGHGAQRCACPETLAGKRLGQRCVVCSHRRHP